ncbi:MAG: sporulation integral membrane protein YtvI [Clostridiales bacterium]|nr:sporulation integral membrane protein YtvI [Clostridiales bacterium]
MTALNSTEKKKKFIIDVIYIAVVLALFYLFMKYAFGLFFPFVVSLFVAYLLQRPVNFICRKTPLKRGPVSVILVLLATIIILFLFSLIVIRLGTEIKDFVKYLMVQLQDIPTFLTKAERFISSHLSFLPDKLEKSITGYLSEKLSVLLGENEGAKGFSSSLPSLLSSPISSLWNTAKQIPSTLIAIVMAIVACCFMTADFKTVKRVILSLFNPDSRDTIVRAKQLLVPSLAKMAKAYLLIITITFSELALGLGILTLLGLYKGGYILIIALIIALIDIVPILGTGTVLVPWAVYLLFTGDYGLAIGILIMYATITIIRQIIEPKLVANQLGLPPFATIISMYIGSQIFGVIGIFLLPITLVMVKLLNDEGLIHVFKTEGLEDEAPKAVEKGEADD